jgi:hypothetical protein
MRATVVVVNSCVLLAAVTVCAFAFGGELAAASSPTATLVTLSQDSTLPDQYRQAIRNYLSKPVQQIIGGTAAASGEFP